MLFSNNSSRDKL
ncbi:hypothetical protein FCT18_03280 [Lysinibacillus sphaericus]|uniref:Uncharacterized protein n=1 Tax=Lysinibacillus tabacifolii TaxID=1173107 RepID=A0ABY2T3U0_9BACI|nr:hypothetical protein FCT18_03280 [Lysinibacillus sphaericus]TKI50706.1 hypothetical protein FC748_02245 [Lysinibacillus tabacifolii]